MKRLRTSDDANAPAPAKPASRDRLVLSLQEPLVVGGPAEEFEQRVQRLLRDGYRNLMIDLHEVPRIDSGGIRALVRGHTTAQRLGARFSLVGPNAHVRDVLRISRLDTALSIYDTLDAAQAREWPWRTIAVVAGGAALCVGLLWGGLRFPPGLLPIGQDAGRPITDARAEPHMVQPFVEVLKLIAAAFIGLLVTAVHRPTPRDKPLSRSIEHAQVLLCVSGAMMMVIIGDSLARAFGIAGAASIIRFRTPVDDPKDVTIIFLLMALGMATGLGSFAVAGLGTAFLCVFLLLLDRVGQQKPRSMMVELKAEGREFPLAHIQSVFARHRVTFEPREVSQGEKATITYLTELPHEISLEDLNADLMAGKASGLKSVSWEPTKKSAQ